MTDSFLTPLLTFDETMALVEAGHREGALARVRTMYELFVVAAVICLHGSPSSTHPELVERYLAHREAFRRSDADALLLSGIGSAKSVIDADVLAKLDARHLELIARYGKPFMRNWGWAAPLFPGASTVSFVKLVDLIEPSFAFFYSTLSGSVHAGSDGWHDSIQEEQQEPAFRAYPEAANMGFPIELASFMLLGAIDCVVPTKIVHDDGETDRTGRDFLGALRVRRQCVSAALEQVSEA